MKYKKLKGARLDSYAVQDLDGGLNIYSDKRLISDNQLCDVKNMYFKNGMLRTREGITANIQTAITDPYGYNVCIKGLTVTGATALYGDEEQKIVYTVWSDEISNEQIRIYLLSRSGTLTSVGEITTQRVDEGSYNRFKSIFFIVGEPKTGCGIYAFMCRQDYDGSHFNLIYELNSAYNSWNRLDVDDYYAPTLLINGRGNGYDEALENRNVHEGTPSKPESMNLLGGRFKAYFSTDGYSSSFSLPVMRIKADTSITVRVYLSPYYYDQWLIPASQNSVTIDSLNGRITLNCTRSIGSFTFYKDNTTYKFPKITDVPNNIVITAVKDSADFSENIITSTACTVYNSDFYICGNTVEPNEIYGAKISNPLYFPEDMKTAVGSSNGYVKGLAVQNNKLIAFKDEEVYKINVSAQAVEEIDATVEAGGQLFKGQKLSTTPINTQIGCFNPNTLALCSNRMVWLGNDRAVYTLATTTYGKENNIYAVSAPIEGILKQFSESELRLAFAFDASGYYMLVIGNKVLALDYRINNFGISEVYTAFNDHSKSISWYVWELPENTIYTSGTGNTAEMRITCTDETRNLCYIADFSGESDTVLNICEGEITSESIDIESYFSSKMFDFSHPYEHKIIEEIFINGICRSKTKITLFDPRHRYSYNIAPYPNALSTIKIIPYIQPFDTVCLSMKSDKAFAVAGMSFNYRITNSNF